ncbi:MAG TPA: DUF367 family protein [Thermoplasmatales archaeon]|nr:DUF367 family protein [Thermoplasmatales archaeon]
MKNIRLLTYHVNQDDPKKCTAKKLSRFGLADITNSLRKIPRRAIILNPSASLVFAPEDVDIAMRYGIVAVDCSWKNVKQVFSSMKRFPNHRYLPFLIPVNPVNYGKPMQLSTLEAFIASLYIIGMVEQAEDLSRLYKWSPHFIELNRKFLDAYRNAKSREEIIDIVDDMI